MTKTKQLSALIESKDELIEFAMRDEFLEFINQAPPKQWIKEHPFAKGINYIPIDKVELMLDKIFQTWTVEILDTGQLLNAIYVNVRLHYIHPITKNKMFQDGTGAVAIQVDKGKNASDLGAIKSNAIMLALPAAKSFAIKDAAEHIGSIFGRNLNRKDTVAFTPSYKDMEDKKNKLKEKLENEDN